MIMNRYCLPLQLSNWAEVTDSVASHQHTTHFFEVWLDYLHDLTLESLTELIAKYPDRIVCVFRRNLLETPTMGQTVREQLLDQLILLNTFIDLDVMSQDKDVKAIVSKQRNAKFIASYHNYSETPSDLREITETLLETHPDIVKIATMCSSELDTAQLIMIKSQLKAQNQPSIVLGMGEVGRLARLVCDIWGNELVFAPQNTETATAPGQFTRQELEKLSTLLGGTL